MVKVTYTDHERAAPYVTFHGVEFSHLVPVEVADDQQHAALLEDCRRHPWFAVEGQGPDPRPGFNPGTPGQAGAPVEEAVSFATPAEIEEFAASAHPDDDAALAKIRKAGAQAYQAAYDRKAPRRLKGVQMHAWEEGYDEAMEREDEARRRPGSQSGAGP